MSKAPQLKTATINLKFESLSDLKETFDKIYSGISNGSKEVGNLIYSYGVVDIEKNYKPIRLQDFGNGMSEVYGSKINEG